MAQLIRLAIRISKSTIVILILVLAACALELLRDSWSARSVISPTQQKHAKGQNGKQQKTPWSGLSTPGLSAPLVPSITATLTDNIATGTKVLPGSTINYTAIINNSGTDASTVNYSHTIDLNTTLVAGSVHASPIAFNDTYNWVGNTTLDSSVRSLPSVTANDVAVNPSGGTDTFTLTTLTNAATSLGGVVTVAANGHFIYTPPLGRPNAADGASVNDSFSYTITNNADNSLTATGTVTIALTGRVWYLLAGASGDGRSGTPSGNPATMSTAADKASDIFFVFSSGSNLNGAFTLDNGQQLLGQGVNLTVNLIPLFAAGAAPTVTNTAGNAVTLGSGNVLSGFNIGSTSGTAIIGSSVGTLNISSLSINTSGAGGNGAGLDLTGVSTPTVNVTLSSLTSTGGTKNVNLVGLNGTISLGSGALSGATGNAFDVSGGAAAISFGGTITQNNAARVVNIQGTTGGSVTLSGTVTGGASSTGIHIGDTSAVNGNVSFTTLNLGTSGARMTNQAVTITGGSGAKSLGAISIFTTGSAQGIVATNSIGAISSTSGTVDTSGAPAINIVGTSSASRTPLNVQLTKVNTAGGSNGILLQNTSSTGSPGGFNILGSSAGNCGGVANPGSASGTPPDTADCTGGQIQTSSGATGGNPGIGVLLTDVDNVSLTRVRVNGHSNFGVKGTRVSRFKLTSSYFHNNGDDVGGDGEGSVYLYELTGGSGDNSITNSYLDLGAARNLHVLNTSGTLDRLTVSGTTIGNDGTSGSDGIFVQADNSANTGNAVTVKTTVQNGRFLGSRGDGIQFSARGTSVTDFVFTGNRMTNNHPNQVSGSTAVTLSSGGSAGSFNPTNTFNISNNIINNNSANNASGPAISVGKGGVSADASFVGTISGNQIGTAGVGNSGSAQGSGIVVDIVGGGVMNATITNNTIRQFTNFGILAQSGNVTAGGGTGNLIVDIRGNNIAQTSPNAATALFPTSAIRVVLGTNSGDNTNNCVKLGGTAVADKNTATGTGTNGGSEIRLFQRFTTILAVSGQDASYAGANNDNAAMNSFIAARNVVTDTTPPIDTGSVNATNNTGSSGPGFSGTCTAPLSLPSLNGQIVNSQRVIWAGGSGPRALNGQLEVQPESTGKKSNTLFEPYLSANTSSPGSGYEKGEFRSRLRFADIFDNSAPKENKNGDSNIFQHRSLKQASYGAAVQKKTTGAPQSGETVTIATPTLPQNKTITIKYSVTVNNPPAAAQVSTQGTVTATGITPVLTNDPDTAAANDPTVTLIDLTITWSGATSSNWDTDTNWNTAKKPVAINDVLIPTAGVTNNPAISASDVTIAGFTMQSGRTLTMSSARTLNVAGNWSNNGTLTAGDGTVVFNGNNNSQTLAGSSTFNNLTVNHTGSGNVSATGSSLTVAGLMRVQAGTFISSSTFKDVQIDSGATLQSDGSTINVSGNWTNNGGTFTPGTGSVIFNNTSAGQTIGGSASSQAFNNLQINKAGQTLIVAGSTATLNINGALTLTAGTFDAGTALTINSSGNWTNDGGTFSPGNGSVIFNSTSAAQAINGSAVTQSFNNLTVNKTGQTLSVAGSTTTLSINGTFLLTAGTFDKGTAATINILGNWTKNGGTFTQGTGTVVFSGPSAQTISGSSATTFNNLTINNASGVTISSAQTLNGTLTLTLGLLTNGANLSLGNGALISRTGGSLAAAPTFGTTVSVTYPGSSAVTTGPEIPASTTALSNLTINNPAGVTLGSNATVNTLLTLTSGDLKTGPTGTEFTLTMPAAATSGPPTGATDVVGNVKRTGFVSAGAALSFGNPFNSIQINSGTAPTDITVNLDKAVPVTPAPFATAIARKYTITPNGGSGFSATLRLHYLDSDLNGNTEGPNLNLFRFDGTNWHNEGQTSNDTTNNWVQKTAVTQFSPWTLNSTVPTDAKLETITVTGYDNGAHIEWKTGNEVDNLGFNIYRDEDGKRVLVNSQIVAGSALLTGSGVNLAAGRSYAWWDAGSSSRAQYWIEDIDLNGRKMLHGPVFVKHIGGVPLQQSSAAVLSQLGVIQAGISRPVKVTATSAVARPDQVKIGGPNQLNVNSLAGQPAAKLVVKHDGFYRVALADLVAAGIDPHPDPDRLQLYAEGRQIPIRVQTDDKGRVSSVEFYGVGLDTPSTDARVYWLISGSEPGLRIQQGKWSGGALGANNFLYAIERKDRTVYFSALRNGERENFFGAVIASEPVDQTMILSNLDSAAAGQATLDVSLQGVTTSQHRVWAYINGTFAGELLFDGQSQGQARFSIGQSQLREGSNLIRFVAQGGSSDVSLVDYTRISYWHTFVADHNNLLLNLSAPLQTTVTGFTNSAIRVFDVTNPDAAEEIVPRVESNKGVFSATFASTRSGERTLLAITENAVESPALIGANRPSTLRSTNHAADLVIITRRDFFPAFEALVQVRAGQGIKSELIDAEDIYDEFNFGNKSPQSVKDFLQYAKTNWKRGPKFVLLGADSSYDPRNYLGFGDWDLAPSKLIDTALMETASDDWFVDFNDDGLPDLAVGRLPARSIDEASAMVAKILAYDHLPPSEEMLLIADVSDTYDFAQANVSLKTLIPQNLRVNLIDRGASDPAKARSQLLDAINRGQKIVSYAGHGSVTSWRGGLLTVDDARLMENLHPSFFTLMTCLNGYAFDPTLDSLAESLIKSDGGAIAVWSSSGMTNPDEQAEMNRRLYTLMFGENARQMTIGEIVVQAKQAINDPDIRRSWILIGDPTLKIR